MLALVALFNGCRDHNDTGFPLHLLVFAHMLLYLMSSLINRLENHLPDAA